MHCANRDAIFHPMENQTISISLGIHGSREPDKMVQQLLSGICTENMPLLLSVVSFQMLWLIHIKTLQRPSDTVCKLLMLTDDYIQLDFNSETTLLK